MRLLSIVGQTKYADSEGFIEARERVARILIVVILAVLECSRTGTAWNLASDVRALAPLEILAGALREPSGVAITPDGRIIVADERAGALFEISSGVQLPRLLVAGLRRPRGVVLEGPDSVLLLAEAIEPARNTTVDSDTNRRPVERGLIMRYALSTDQLTIKAHGLKHARALALARDGTVFVSSDGLVASGPDRSDENEKEDEDENQSVGLVLRWTAASGFQTIASGFTCPDSIVVRSDGTLLVGAEKFTANDVNLEGSLFSVDGSGHVAVYAAQPLKRPAGLVIDATGGVFVAGQRGTQGSASRRGVVLKVSRDGAITEFASGLDRPSALAVGVDGHLLATDVGLGLILRFRAPDQPSLGLDGPVSTNLDPFPLRGSSAPDSQIAVLGGRELIAARVVDGTFEIGVPMRQNQRHVLNVFTIGAEGAGLASAPTSLLLLHDNIPPGILGKAEPEPNAAGWHRSRVRVVFFCEDLLSGVAACEPPIDVTADDAGRQIVGTARDRAGNAAEAAVLVRIDSAPPGVTASVSPPPNAAGWHNSDVTVSFVCDDSLSDVSVCPQAHTVTTEGANQTIAGSASDVAGNSAQGIASVNLDKTPPLVQITSPRDVETVTGSPLLIEGTVTDALSGVTTITCNGNLVDIVDSRFTCGRPLEVGANSIVVQASDAANNSASRRIDVTFAPGPSSDGLPADPSTVAPPLDRTSVTPFSVSTRFLYTGANPIQVGVRPGAIDARRASVIRGKVMTRAGAPLAGVRITIHGQAEFGSTLTRADGMFDLAANGGGPLTIQYQKAEFLPAQRQIQVPWQDFAFAPDVALVQLDPEVATVNLAPGPAAVARGRVVTDADGTRQATVIFPEGGIMANMELPDGRVLRAQGILHIRMAEYTVGANGRRAMPGELPSTSGYTYAFKLTADEVTAADARTITVSPPLPYYVENFLDFPVGGVAPAGFYDTEKAAWIPSPNGRIVRILGVKDGLVDLDIEGNGQPATSTALADLGVTTGERQRLADLYAPGQSLWRVPLGHFSSVDINWPYRPDCDPAVQSCAPSTPPQDNQPTDDPCLQQGSIIECQNQTLGESLPIEGTPFTLNYRSDRVPGRKASYNLTVPLSGPTVPSTLQRIDLTVDVAGQRFTRSFPGQANQRTTFTWDGKDAYARPVQGQRPYTVRVGYIYRAVYLPPGPSRQGFGVMAASLGIPLSANPAREQITFWREWKGSIGAWDARAVGIGGWTLSTHHAYDPDARVLHFGTGSRRRADALPDAIETVAGDGSFCAFADPCGDGGPAKAASLATAAMIAIGFDGSIYVPDRDGSRIRRIGPDGVIRTIAGGNGNGFAGDGGPATSAGLSAPAGIAIGPDGSLYIADTGNGRVRRVGLDGIITTVAGNGAAGFIGNPNPPGDDGPATDAQLDQPRWITVGADGTIYLSDSVNNRLRRVTPDGLIKTFAGFGVFQRCLPGDLCGDGGAAALATFFGPEGIALGPDGSLYVADTLARRIRRITPDGRVTTIAGRLTGQPGFEGDGGPATDALFNVPKSVTVAADGSLYIADQNNNRVRVVAPDGIIRTLAGTGSAATGDLLTGFVINGGDGGPAPQAAVFSPDHALIGPDGGLYIWSSNSRRVRRVAPVVPGSAAGNLVIAAEDGSEIYVFDNSGRHLHTLHGLTGAPLYEFHYGPSGILETVTDGDGNVTVVEHDASGGPVAILGPFGRRTTISADINGYLSRVTNAATESVAFGSTDDGLLTTFTNARDETSRFTYDALGRLTLDADAAGGTQALSRTDADDAFSVSMTTELGRKTTYQIEGLPKRAERRVNTFADGLRSESVKDASGTVSGRSPDGTASLSTLGPDPRWGLQAPVATSATFSTPAGLRPTVSTTRVATLSNARDPLSLIAQTETVSINDRQYSTAYVAASRTVVSTMPTGRRRTATLDVLGRPTQLQVGGLHPVTRTYDNRGRLAMISQGTGVDARIVTLTYGADGLVDAVTDPLGRKLVLKRDAVGRVTTATLPDGRSIGYSYDTKGNPTAITPPGRPAHRFSFTPVDLLSSYESPAVAGGQSETLYTYDVDRRLTRETRPDGRTIDLDYDTSGRLTALTIARGAFHYSYDALTGQLAEINAPGGVGMAYAYDGPLPVNTTWTGTVRGSVRRTYDNDLHTTSLATGGSSISFTYDADGLVAQAGSLALSRNAQNGLLTGTTLGTITDAWTYSGFGEPTTYAANHGSATVFGQQYTRDRLGRITQQVETIAGITDIYHYGYDLAGRLATVTRNGATTAVYAYDANGNRLSLTTPSGTIAAGYDAQDRLVQYGAATYTYTANGELRTETVGGQTTTYDYDTLGNLLAVVLSNGMTITYDIDGRNRRIGKRVNGVLVQGFLYQDDLKPMVELDRDGIVVSRFVYATHANVPDYMIKNGAIYRIITDQRGSPRLVVDVATGTVAQRIDYDEFGSLVTDSNPGFQPFGFAGGLYESASHLVRLGVRDYHPQQGRWISKDPRLFAGGDMNLYSYATGDPVNFVDLTGFEAHSVSTGTDLGDAVRWWLVPNPLAKLEKLGMVATANVFALTGATIATICTAGQVRVWRHGERVSIFRAVQEPFNDLYLHIADHIYIVGPELHPPDRYEETKRKQAEEFRQFLDDFDRWRQEEPTREYYYKQAAGGY